MGASASLLAKLEQLGEIAQKLTAASMLKDHRCGLHYLRQHRCTQKHNMCVYDYSTNSRSEAKILTPTTNNPQARY